MPPVVTALSGFCCGYRRLLHNDLHRSHTSTVRTGAKKRAETVVGTQNNYRRFTADGSRPVKLCVDEQVNLDPCTRLLSCVTSQPIMLFICL